MNRATFTLGALLVGALGFWSWSDAQVELGKALVGTWKGDVQTLGKGTREDPHRTLIITSVMQKDGKWVGEARFGTTGKGLGRVHLDGRER